tara:strand:+ start:1743 stop:2468 length:726 start_codon:yes stop_codon:yes gene_type:complete
MRKKPLIFTSLQTQDEPVPPDILDMLAEPMGEAVIRQVVRAVLLEQMEAEQGVEPGFAKNEWTLLQPGDSRREDVKSELYDMVCTTYEQVGGHPKICDLNSLDRYTYWIVEDLDEDPQIDVAMFGKPKPMGNKLGAAANDGSAAASSAYKTKSAELRSGGTIGGVGNWWGEVSGKPAYALLKRGAPVIEDEATVRALLKGKPIEWHGQHPDPSAAPLFKSAWGWYTRTDLGFTKIIVGSPG